VLYYVPRHKGIWGVCEAPRSHKIGSERWSHPRFGFWSGNLLDFGILGGQDGDSVLLDVSYAAFIFIVLLRLSITRASVKTFAPVE
jgi:hypothetical protein